MGGSRTGDGDASDAEMNNNKKDKFDKGPGPERNESEEGEDGEKWTGPLVHSHFFLPSFSLSL
jgi:hypothetical protein